MAGKFAISYTQQITRVNRSLLILVFSDIAPLIPLGDPQALSIIDPLKILTTYFCDSNNPKQSTGLVYLPTCGYLF